MSYEDIAARAKSAGHIESLTARLIKWSKGTRVVGRYLGRELRKSKKAKLPDYYSYNIETDSGPMAFLGGQAFDANAGAKMVEGEIYDITFEGKVEIGGGHTFNQFTVLHIQAEPTGHTERAAKVSG